MSIAILSGFTLPPKPEYARQIVSAPERRTGAFNQEYDFHTLFYDAFYSRSRGALCIICPPLLNLKALFCGAQWSADGKPLRISALHAHKRFVEVWMRGVEDPGEVRFRTSDIDVVIPVSRAEPELFEGLRCVVTKSRNNDLRWIRDWADYHVKVHGLEAVILFDHGSDLYSVQNVEDTLLAVPGIKRALVIPSPYPFGPTTDNDSLFLQVAELNIARLRFTSRAAGVLVCDIDELITPSPEGSVFDIARRSLLGYALFKGSWRYPDVEDGDPTREHRDHTLRRIGQPDCSTKYCIVPGGLAGAVHWDIHGAIRGTLKPYLITNKLHYWHCYGISTGWKVDRSDVNHHNMAHDSAFAAVMGEVFPAPAPLERLSA